MQHAVVLEDIEHCGVVRLDAIDTLDRRYVRSLSETVLLASSSSVSQPLDASC